VPRLRVHLFGYPRLEHDGIDVPIRRRKALALLSYLATTRSSHSRDTLAALLWPEHEAPRAFAFLRNALWILNGTPLADWLVSSRHTIGLRDGSHLAIDVGEFRRALSDSFGANDEAALSRLAGATDLFRSDFLAGFSIEDSEPFEDWQYSESSALRHELGTALDRLADARRARNDFPAAIRFARRWLEIQPLNEAVHRRLMELHAAAGQRAEALAQYAACEQTFKRELGLAPSEETAALAEQIRRSRVATPRPAEPRRAPLNLPAYRTAFAGRDAELARAASLLDGDECRLLTIAGPGGSGKTRLAIEAARHAADRFPDGVVFVSLVATASSSDVPVEIEEVLGTYSVPAEDVEERPAATPGLFSDLLLARLKPQRLLLVLDNLEHLLIDLRWLRSLLDLAPGIKVLVTSRHQLRLKDEWILAVEGLPFPSTALPPEDLAELDSVSLFLQAARRANTSFTPSDEDWAAIADIVRLLEGMPLGIELAAAWVRSVSCRTIADEIDKSMDFLATGLRDVPKRHHSLRAVFEQSWELLSKDARRAFRRLAVFRSGFTRDAAEAVADTTLPVISGLVARSLLRPTEPGRTEIVEVLRQYAEERLRTLPEEEERIRRAHASYFIAYLAEQEEALKGGGQRRASELLLADVDNIRAAWRWAIDHAEPDMLERAATGLFLFCDMRNRFDEGARLFRDAASPLADAKTERERLLFGLLRGLEAWFTGMRYSSANAQSLFEESLAVLQPIGVGREAALIGLLWSFGGHGKPDDVKALLQDSLAFFRDAHARWEEAEVLEALAWRMLSDEPDAAIGHALRAVEIHQELGDPWGVAMARFSLGSLYTASGDFHRARIEIEESLALRRANDLDPMGAMQCTASLGYLASEAGDLAEASRRYQEALALAEEAGAQWAQATTHESLIGPSWALGIPDRAAYHTRAAASIYRSLGRESDAARCESQLEALRSA